MYKTRPSLFVKSGNLTYIAALLTLIILPVHVQYLPPFLILWILLWIVENYSRFANLFAGVGLKYRYLFILFISYYLWQVAGLVYSSDIKMGLLNLFGRLSLVLFPLVLIVPGEKIKKDSGKLVRVFPVATLLLMLFSFGNALYRSLNFQDGSWIFNPHPPEYPWSSYFYGAELIDPQHPSYISMYALISAFICFEVCFDHSKKYSSRVLWLMIGLLLLIFQYFLSSRAGILLSFALVFIYCVFRFRKLKNRVIMVFTMLLSTAILLPVIFNNQRISDLYKRIINWEENAQSTIDPRSVVWESALNIAKSNIITGLGIGDARTELVNEYERIGENGTTVIERYNAHNQFLETLLESGIIGLVLLVSIIGVMIYIAVSEKNLIYALFIVIMIAFFMIETVLYRLAGVSFFSLFSFLLLYLKPEKYMH